MFKKLKDSKRASNPFSRISIKIIICFFIGLIVISQSENIAIGFTFLFNFNTELIKTIIIQIGLSLITYILIDSIFIVWQNNKIGKRVDDFAEKLGENIEKLQYSVGITQGALKTGLSAVKATRSDAIKEIKEEIDKIINKYDEDSGQEFKIKILGISLGDYLCPHGPLYHEFKELISMPRVKIQILILKDGSYSAIQRAKIEENHVFKYNRKIIESKKNDSGKYECEKYKMDPFDPSLECKFNNVKSEINIDAIDCYSYLQTKCHNELKTATSYLYDLCNNEERIRKDAAEKIENEDNCKRMSDDRKREKIEYKVRVWKEKWKDIKSYDYAPLLLMIEFDDTMFVENYHLASRGGESPVLQIKKETNLFKIYDDHFNRLYDDLGLSLPIDSCSYLNKPCIKGAAIAELFKTKKTAEPEPNKKQDQQK